MPRVALRRLSLTAVFFALLISLTWCLPAMSRASDSVVAPHLPTRVNAPGPWAEDWSPGQPVAAIGLADRKHADGLRSTKTTISLFAVSAIDGSSGWVATPGTDPNAVELSGWFALSPNGRWIGWERRQPRAIATDASDDSADNADSDSATIAGWSVMNTETGTMRQLDPPADASAYAAFRDLAFTGDSRYLVTSYDVTPTGDRDHLLAAWDLTTGTATVLESSGASWLPNLGSAPDGVVWSRGHRTTRFDAATGHRATFDVSDQVVTASWSPQDTSVAYISAASLQGKDPWVLHVGAGFDSARRIGLPVEPHQIVGWSDDRHVVVGHDRRQYQVVDVVTGSATTVDLAGEGEPLNPPLLAADLWQQQRWAPAARTGTSDPRHRYLWGSGAATVTVGGAAGLTLLLRLRRRSRRLVR